MIPGTSTIARPVSAGAGSTEFKAADLVYLDCVVKSRDDLADVYLSLRFLSPLQSQQRS